MPIVGYDFRIEFGTREAPDGQLIRFARSEEPPVGATGETYGEALAGWLSGRDMYRADLRRRFEAMKPSGEECAG